MMLPDHHVHEWEASQIALVQQHQRARYFPGSSERIICPPSMWLGQTGTIATTHGPFHRQPYPAHWGSEAWPYDDNSQVSAFTSFLHAAPLTGLPRSLPASPEGAVLMASTLPQSQLGDAVPVGHCDNGNRRWKEYIPRARAGWQSEEAPVVHSPVQSRKAETKTKSEILEIEEQEEPPAAVNGAKRRDQVHKTKMKINMNTKKTKQQAPPLNSFGLYFTEVTEAHQKARRLDWPPREDESLPETKEERIAVVRKLFTAIQDTSDIQDKLSSPMLKKRWLAENVGESGEDRVGNAGETKPKQKIATNTVYKPWVKERLCWDILVSSAIAHAMTGANMNKETAERIYREGAGFVSILDPVMIDRCEKSRNLTFEERISKLVGVLKSYKSRVDKLLRGGCVEEYVLCPDTLLQISSSNRQQNDERQKDLTAGRKREDRLVKKPGKKKQIRRSIIRYHGTSLTVAVAPTPASSRKRTRSDSEDASDVEEPQKRRTRRT